MAASAMSSPAAPSTPSSSRSASPVLTPRSKVRAMLVQINGELGDSDDDDEEGEGMSVLLKKAAAGGVRKSLFNAPPSDDDEEEEEEEEPARPRGKLAARMLAEHEAKAPTAYERVKNALLPQKPKAPPPPAAKAPTTTTDSSENDEDIPLTTSRRKKTPQKPTTTTTAVIDSSENDEDIPFPAPRRKKTPQKPTTAPPRHSRSPTPQSTDAGTATPALDADDDDDDDADMDAEDTAAIRGNERFQALVAKKQAERKAKEAAEAEKRAARSKLDAQMGTLGPGEEEDSGDDDDDDEGGVRSQRAPTRRKAGKKALEEMHRETQRMARSMQLAHQARTRKKITKQSLFEKFGFRPEGAEEEKAEESTATTTTTDQPPASSPGPAVEPTDDTTMDVDVPPPAPMDLDPTTTTTTPSKDKGKSILRVPTTPQPTPLTKDKGKSKAPAPAARTPTPQKPTSRSKPLTLPAVRVVGLPKGPPIDPDSDSDLEFVPTTAPRTAQSERQAMLQSLRAARRPSPPKERKPGQLTAKELQAQLRKKGWEQAKEEREEQIRELRARGVVVLTAEERAEENREVEDLLEKARLEALAIKKAEKREMEGKGAVKMEGEYYDEEEDEDWLEEEEEGEEGSGMEEEEDEEGEEGEVGEQGDKKANDFSDEEKKEGDEDEDDDGTNTPTFSLSSMYPRDQPSPSATPRLSEIPAAYIDDEAGSDSDSDGGGFAPLRKISQQKKEQRKKMRTVADDSDEDSDTMKLDAETEKEQEKEKPKSNIPSIFQRTEPAPAFMGMTQLFAGTIGASGEMQVQDSQARIDLLRRGPGETLPNSQILDFDGPSQDVSQSESNRLRLDYTQSQVWAQESVPQQVVLGYEPDPVDDMPDPTQDQGFEHGSSQTAPPRFTQTQEVTSTISTQILDSQLGVHRKRRGRLTRKETEFSDEEEEKVEGEEERMAESETEENAGDIAENVFDIMKKASKKKKKERVPIDMEKLKADTKGLVEDQAQESEDEYAGIGGASDDEVDNGHDSEMEDMMDDSNKEIVDENAIAAFYAEREKAQDEKDVNKLLKDLQSGLLRKKRGADFDLDDSDDEDSAEARRRAAKRRQMAKMRRELLKDGAIEKIASNPKRLAFLSAIEDRDQDEEMDFLDRGEEDLFIELGMVNQSQEVREAQDSPAVDSGEASPAPVPIDDSEPASREGSKEGSREITPLPLPPSRRPVKPKVSTLAHVREQLSFLVEEKESQFEVSDDEEEEDGSAAIVQRQRRTTAVIDRVAVARSASAVSENAKMAFQTSGAATGFKVPQLLRRTTTSSTISTGSEPQKGTSQGTERSLGQTENAAGVVKRGGKASSSINFHAREQVRSKVQNERESKKKLERKKEGQKRQSVLGMFAKGGFS